MPGIELGVNDMWRQGKEVVGRHDIIPVATEEWIRLEAVEFHHIVNQEQYARTRTIKCVRFIEMNCRFSLETCFVSDFNHPMPITLNCFVFVCVRPKIVNYHCN